MASPNK